MELDGQTRPPYPPPHAIHEGPFSKEESSLYSRRNQQRNTHLFP
ncbi:MAG: hypothetical protein ACI9QR_001232 [Flavobacteriaceae bacterium]|jgi:hypothetical protein